MSELPPEWHGGSLPPGTPAPTSSAEQAFCKRCDRYYAVTIHTELGASYIEPEECPGCGEPWPDDLETEPDEPDPDQEYDSRIDREFDNPYE